MSWPTIFANLAGGNQPLSLFDTMFNQVAQMVAIPTTAAGSNAITLTPIGTAPALSNYQNFSSFRFVAAATTTSLVTAQYQALGFVPVYLADGLTQATTGNIVINQEYVLVFIQQLNGGGGGFILEAAAVTSGATTFAPNVQVFLSGTGATYTTPTAGGRLPLYLRVRMVGSGGGGGAQNTNAGTAGTDTSFASWTAIHGAGGAASNGGGGAGGTGGVNGTGTQITRVTGAAGNIGTSTSTGNQQSGDGGQSPFGGRGNGVNSAAGGAAAANTGSGGGGGAVSGNANCGSGGGAGEYVEFTIPTPVASYLYTVGAQGTGGAAGGNAGGNGAAGRIEVIAYWQ